MRSARTFVALTRSAIGAIGLAMALSVAAPSALLAHVPTTGASKGSFVKDQAVTFKYASASYPSWLTTAVTDTLQNYYHDANHNSHAPSLTYSSNGTAVVHYVAQTTSPCGTGSQTWLMCTTGGGSSGWDIYVRDLDNSGSSNNWWEETPHCSAGSTCYYVHRAMIHESGHAMLSFADESGWSEDDTVMNGIDPHVGATGATHWDYQRCDEAASQLLWDLKNSAGEYGDCFDDIVNHGTHGLKTDLTMGTTSYSACNGDSIIASGRIQVHDYSSYGPLGGNPLTNRTVWVDRGSTLKFTSAIASNASNDNWSVTLNGSSVTYSYSAHFDYSSGSGLDASAHVAFTARWGTAC
ncbi:MAG TPA: hypothetical protein VFW92_04730 [Candidatus Limnocylindrales bacterium]|nr:hypothetical protein [Candidatus Limnocylindrales bacterium]